MPYIKDRKLYTWWRHQLETFSALLALCAGNSPVTGEFHAQRVTRSFDIFFDLHPNKRLSKHNREAGDLRRHRAQYDVSVIKIEDICVSDIKGHLSFVKTFAAETVWTHLVLIEPDILN